MAASYKSSAQPLLKLPLNKNTRTQHDSYTLEVLLDIYKGALNYFYGFEYFLEALTSSFFALKQDVRWQEE